MKTLTAFTKYDTGSLKCVGWIDSSALDGTPAFGATDGYDWLSYFRDDGVYLGHDKFNIEPLFEEQF